MSCVECGRLVTVNRSIVLEGTQRHGVRFCYPCHGRLFRSMSMKAKHPRIFGAGDINAVTALEKGKK